MMTTTQLESAVRGAVELEEVKDPMISFLDDIVKRNTDGEELRDRALVLLDSLVNIKEHECVCDHDDDDIDELKARVVKLQEKLDEIRDHANDISCIADVAA